MTMPPSRLARAPASLAPARILVLTPWLVHRFRHGGQLRASAILDAYRRAGHEVRCIGLYDPARTPADEPSPHDLALGDDVARSIAPGDADTELGFWRALARAPSSSDFFRREVETFHPDVIQFDEPYLWPVAAGLRAGSRKLLHSSHNFETAAKRELAASGLAIGSRTLADVAATEREIAAGADAIAVVSAQDRAAFMALGARRVVVAPNGTAPHAPDAAADAAVAAYVGASPFALFVSSAHPPNAEGLVEMLRAAPPGVWPDVRPGAPVADARARGARLLVGGGVASLLRDRKDAAQGGGAFEAMHLLGLLDAAALGAMHRRAACIVLPKTRGGGSNLKTAEALMSGRPIVATTRAFEGFEAHATDAGVTIEDEPARFWAAVRAHVEATRPSPDRRAPQTLQDLSWAACLAPMVDLAAALAHEARGGGG